MNDSATDAAVLKAIDDAMLTNRFLFLGTGTRHAVTFRAGDHSPLFRQICVIGGLLGGPIVFLAHQLPPGLLPISLGKFVRVALINHRNFPCTLFNLRR